MTDRELLQQYAETGSQEAFAELVSHHSDWIYSAALRLVRRRDYAEDVTQAVFLVLAQRAKKLDVSTLNGWLFKVTRYCASNILREENRREKRERRAAIMNSQIREVVAESTWDEIAPVLEQTVGRLRAADRKAVLLRFYQQKSLSEVGDALGISEEAARKRVAKALAKLWSLLSVHRVMLPAAGVAVTLLSERITHAAPPGLGASCLPGAGTATAAHIAQGVNQMLFALKLKIVALAILVMSLIPAGIWISLRISTADQLAAPAAPLSSPAQPAPIAGVAEDDATITPFFTSHTQIIVSVNFSLIDLKALEYEQKKCLYAAIDPNDPRRSSVDREIAQTTTMLSSASLAISSARLSHFYPMVARLSATNTSGFFVAPIHQDSDIAGLDRFMKTPGLNTPDGKTRVYCGKNPPFFLLSDMSSAAKRPDFADAMATGPDAAIRIVFNPGFSGEINHTISTLRTLGLGAMSEPQWATVKWCHLAIIAPPNVSGTLILQCADADSAVAMANLLSDKFTALHANPPADAIAAPVANFIGDVKPVVSGSMVTINLNQKIMEPILVDWFLSAMPQGTPRRMSNPPPQPTPDGGL